MGLFDKIKEPIFLKEESTAYAQLTILEQMRENADNLVKEKIDIDIRALKAGIAGESNIAFELRNSHLPMFVLHDLYIERGDLSAQIDYLIVTRKRIFVVECKNLYGNIEINSAGDFIRSLEYNGKIKKEGVYSPITQNRRHLELLREIRFEQKNKLLTTALFDKYFYDTYRSVVVLANPQTVLNFKYAKKEIKEQVIRADQLIEYIKRINAQAGIDAMSERDMESYARYFLSLHRDNPIDYTEKYKEKSKSSADTAAEVKNESNQVTEVSNDTGTKAQEDIIVSCEEPTDNHEEENQILCPKCNAPMIKRKASKGINAGKEFYGCSNFPKCRGIVNIQ